MSKLGLALGGGGARGLAHIGVLKVIESEGIKINCITGCSMGAIIGGLYSYYGNVKETEDFVRRVINDPKFIDLGIDDLSEDSEKHGKNFFEQFFDYIGTRLHVLKTLNHPSYFDDDVTNEIYELIPDVPIENLKIKFSAIATDLLSGEEINFTKGSLRNAIRASSAIPGIFPPVKYQNYFLVDGSASESVPAGKVRWLGANRVLAVDVTRNLRTVEEPENIIEILFRTEDITSYHLSDLRLREADLIIRPQVKQLTWADFDRIDEIISAGEKAAKDNIKEIKKLVYRGKYLFDIKHHFKKLGRGTKR